MKPKKLKSLILALFLTSLVLSGNYGQALAAEAAKDSKGEDWKYHTIVDVKFVMQYAVMPQPKNVLIVDVRPKQPKFDNGNIPTAINIPMSKFDEMTDKLPQDKNTLLIFYCEGPTWRLSHEAAWKAEKMGYTNVKVFAEGFPGWESVPTNYIAVEASYVKKQIDSKAPVVLIDSRPKRAKYDKGHIPGAISIPDPEFEARQGNLPQDKNTPLIFYCEGYTWVLSHDSARKAVQLGYTKVSVFSAGYPAWEQMAGSAAPKVATIEIPSGKEEGSINTAAFEKILAENPQSILLIDVRKPAEFENGHFKTAVNIPVNDLQQKAAALPSDKPIVFVCNTGAQSGEAYFLLKDQRPELKKVYYLDAVCEYEKDGSYKITQTK
jgi:rhodanese-related sulfurtransferase